MKGLKLKLIMSVTGILMGVVMLLSASYAWLTVSVAPEIRGLVIQVVPTGKEIPFELSINYDPSKPDEAVWTTVLHLDDILKDKVLRPISTVDGDHWFLPKYNAKGDVVDFWEADFKHCANADADSNYLVYADVWVRTRNDIAQDMVLSKPLDKDGGYNVMDTETFYGSYALWAPEKNAEGTGWKLGTDNKLAANDAMASLRVGLQYMEYQLNAESVEGSGTPKIDLNSGISKGFYIYEPNADMRSTDFTTFLGGTPQSQMAGRTYHISGVSEDATGGNTASGKTTTGNKVQEYQSKFTAGNYYSTLAPKYIKDANGNATWELVDVRQTLGNRLIVQKQSTWNETALSQLTDVNQITSKTIDKIGDFMKVNESGFGGKVPTSNALTTVKQETIQKMRVYIWLEGQDVDCWNQIAGGNLYINLEFMGQGNKQSKSQ